MLKKQYFWRTVVYIIIMFLTCYQTLEDRNNPDEIEQKGPFICSRNDFWLGKGYYFWDTNIEWAHAWGQFYVKNGYVICKTLLRHDEFLFDLWGNVAHQQAFRDILTVLQKRVPKGEEIVVRHVLVSSQKTGSFLFNGIRAFDEPNEVQTIRYNSGRKEVLIINQRVQICLLNQKSLVSQDFRIVFPNHYVM